jgi:hypothetical protein
LKHIATTLYEYLNNNNKNEFFINYKHDKYVYHITSKSNESNILKNGFKTGYELNVAEKRHAIFFADKDVNYGIYARNKDGEIYAGEEIGEVCINLKGLNLLNMTYKNKKGKFENHDKYKYINIKGELDKIPYKIDGTISFLADGRIYEVALKKEVANKRISVLNEYVTNSELYLRDYLAMTKKEKIESLPPLYHWFFDDFLIETDTDFDKPQKIIQSNYADEPEEYVDMFDDTSELVNWLEYNNKEIYNSFANYLYNKIESFTLPIDDSEYPAWVYFSDDPKIIKNQWLIHFTNNANDIAKDGFKYGIDDVEKLGLTVYFSEFDKKYGGYNFSYLVSDFPKYAKGYRGDYKYGKQAVVFKASGIRVWHNGDQEYQVIFYGNTATNIIPIITGRESKWGIYNKNRLLFENDSLEKVVQWLTNNFEQYRKNFKY